MYCNHIQHKSTHLPICRSNHGWPSTQPGSFVHSRAPLPAVFWKWRHDWASLVVGFSQIWYATSTLVTNLPQHVLFGCIRFVHTFQGDCELEQKYTWSMDMCLPVHLAEIMPKWRLSAFILQFEVTFPGCVPSAALCVSSTTVCNFTGLCTWFIAIESRNRYFTNAAHSRNMGQYWQRSMFPNGVTWEQWV